MNLESSSLGRAMLIFCAILVLAAYLFMNLSWIVVCSGLVVFFVYSRHRFLSEMGSSQIRIDREVLDELTFAREPVAVRVRITNLSPTAMDAHLEDIIPDDCAVVQGSNRVTARIPARSAWSFTYSFVPERRGRHTIGGVRVLQSDVFGLHVHRREMPLKTTVVVHTRRESLSTARDVARKEHFEYAGMTRMPTVVLREFEHAWVRDYVPGDKARDIHWKAFSKLGKLMTKTYVKEGTLETIVMVDCSRSMRLAAYQVAKIDHATDLAIQLSRVLLSNYHRTGVIAFDETSVISSIESSLSKHQFERVLMALSDIPGAMRSSDPSADSEHLKGSLPSDSSFAKTSGESEAFLDALRTITNRRHSGVREIGLAGVVGDMIARRHGGERLFVVISDLISSKESVMSAARLCRRADNRILVIQTFDDWYSKPSSALDVQEAERLYGNMNASLSAEAALRRLGASFLRVGPADSTARIVRSIRRGVA